MNYSRIILILLLFTASASLFAQFQPSDLKNPESLGMSTDSLAQMSAYFHQLVDEDSLAGVQIGIIRLGELIHFDSYGFSDIENDKSLKTNSLFRIFSMTKPIVSVALMQLYEQDKFELEDPLHKYIPSFKNTSTLEDSTLQASKNPIRIIDLLRHTSGYSYGNTQNPLLREYYIKANLNASKTNEEFVDKLSKIPLQFEPGTDWQYGLSTNICGRLIEVLSGKSLDQYLKNHILTPLKMNDTHFQMPKEKIERFTVGYGWNAENGLFVVENVEDNRYVHEVTLFNGGGGLVSTTFDYLKFCQMLLNKGSLGDIQILKSTTIDLMLSDHLKEVRPHQINPLRLPPGEASFGLGFAIRGEHPESLEQLFGWGGAVGTYFKIDLKHNLAYVMMIQLSPYRHLELRAKIQDFINGAIVES
ncbi:MAG: serine hydrolase domain-containing protein [Bacteroidota bacterium]